MRAPTGWRSALGLLGAFSVACASTSLGPKAARHSRVVPRYTHMVHEDCPVNDRRALREDINGDGRPDRVEVKDGPRIKCRSLDFDFDGVVDAWVYLDAAGKLRRRENDYDRDGRADEISLFSKGLLTEQRRSTQVAGKLDTWQYYAGGKVVRTERDSNGDDYVDQWWEYPAGRPPDCPLVHSDVDGDGRPDPAATVDVCRERYTGSQAEKPAAPVGALDEVPTEVAPAPSAPAAGTLPTAPPPASPGLPQ